MSFATRAREIKNRLRAIHYERIALKKELRDIVDRCDHRQKKPHQTVCPVCGEDPFYIDPYCDPGKN